MIEYKIVENPFGQDARFLDIKKNKGSYCCERIRFLRTRLLKMRDNPFAHDAR